MLDPLGVLGEHQGAARLLDRALRRATAGWSRRPSTSPSTSARCPRRSPRCCAHDPAPGESWILNDPYAGGTHLPDITHRLAHASSASPSRARTTPTSAAPSPAACPPARATLDEEGVVIPPTRLDDATLDVARRADAEPRRAPRRPARAARGAPARRAAPRRALRAARRATASRPRWTSSSPTRSARARGDRASSRTGATRPPTCSRPPTGDARDPRRGDDRRRRDRRSTSPAPRRSTTGNLNCPLAVTRSACFFVVRCLTDPDLPASGGAFAPVDGRARPRARLVNARSPGGRRRRQRRDVEPDRRRRLRARSARRSRSRRRARGR